VDIHSYCKAMAAFCRQRARFEGEHETFWTTEAIKWDNLIRSADTQVKSGNVFYRLPKIGTQRDLCRGPCELLLKFA
jgi:hypothetical protein